MKEVGPLTEGMKYRIPSSLGKGVADHSPLGCSLSNSFLVNSMVSPGPGLIQAWQLQDMLRAACDRAEVLRGRCRAYAGSLDGAQHRESSVQGSRSRNQRVQQATPGCWFSVCPIILHHSTLAILLPEVSSPLCPKSGSSPEANGTVKGNWVSLISESLSLICVSLHNPNPRP